VGDGLASAREARYWRQAYGGPAGWSSATGRARARERVWWIGAATVMLKVQRGGPGAAQVVGAAGGRGARWGVSTP
jgi:hypothetical protein